MLIECSECGKQISDKAVSCPHCGAPATRKCQECHAPIPLGATTCPSCGIPLVSSAANSSGDNDASGSRQDKFFSRIERIERERYEREINKSDKSRLAYVLLGLFLGWLGIHNFYLGKTKSAVIQLILGLVGFVMIIPAIISAIWAIVDICSVTTDVDGKPLS